MPFDSQVEVSHDQKNSRQLGQHDLGFSLDRRPVNVKEDVRQIDDDSSRGVASVRN